MSKWIKTDPATLKVGDEVRMVDAFSMFQISGKAIPSKIGICVGGIDFTEAPECRTWFVRKPKKAKPEPDLVEGHDAKFWFCRWEKQLNHNEQLQAANSGRRVKMQRLEKEVKDACKDTQYWQNKYAVLAASINEVPDEPSPPTRPDEPPVGSFFRVERTGNTYLRRVCQGGNCVADYLLVEGWHDGYGPSRTGHWEAFTEPGDTITRLLLVEATDD